MYNTMSRWVERKGKRVEFGNIVGPFCGKSYKFTCRTVALAEAFEKFVSQVDTDGMPVGVGPERQAEFGATQTTAADASGQN